MTMVESKPHGVQPRPDRWYDHEGVLLCPAEAERKKRAKIINDPEVPMSRWFCAPGPAS